MSVRARRLLGAVVVTAIDVALLLSGLAAGWFTGGGLLVSAWAQSALLVLAVPVIVLLAAARAPDTPVVNALPLRASAHRQPSGSGAGGAGPDLPKGRTFAGLLGIFFVVHYGMFLLGIGVVVGMFAFSGVGLGETVGAGVLLLAVRSVLSNIPAVLADARFLGADGSSFLAGRTMAVVGLAYRRMVPLHVGIIALSFLEVQWWPYGVVAIVATITFVGALWRHPTHEELTARSQQPTAGATTPPPLTTTQPLRPPPPPPPPPPAGLPPR